MAKGRSIVAGKSGSRQRAYKCDQNKQDVRPIFAGPSKHRAGGRYRPSISSYLHMLDMLYKRGREPPLFLVFYDHHRILVYYVAALYLYTVSAVICAFN